MADDVYELFAIRYATNPRRTHVESFTYNTPDDMHDAPMRLDFFVWVARNERRVVLIDSGASQETCVSRGHDFLCCPTDGLARIGVGPDDVGDLITTHLHWDHGGNIDRFPRARLHVQQREIAHATGPSMSSAHLRRPYDLEQVTAYLKRLYGGSVTVHDGEQEIASGIAIRQVGGHTPGMQIVRVNTPRGYVVLASDAMHYYANRLLENPYPVHVNLSEYVAAWETISRLAETSDHVVPGHDPAILSQYPAPDPYDSGIVCRLDVAPTPLQGDA